MTDGTSTDHDWGRRLQLLLDPTDHALRAEEVVGALDAALVDHRVEVLTLADLLERHLGPAGYVLLGAGSLPTPDWLATPQQELLALTSGVVLHDDVGLSDVRRLLAWYPEPVWLWLMAGCWSHIGEDEHLAPRAGQAGDDLGSRVVTARLVRTAMQLALLQHRRYAPYAKWLGSAVARLPDGDGLGTHLANALAASSWERRNQHVARACEVLAERHEALAVTARVRTTARPFHSRPFEVIGGSDVAGALLAAVDATDDPDLAGLLLRRPIGGIDLVTASTDVLADPVWRGRMRGLWTA